jgi:hypothetical protein
VSLGVQRPMFGLVQQSQFNCDANFHEWRLYLTQYISYKDMENRVIRSTLDLF